MGDQKKSVRTEERTERTEERTEPAKAPEDNTPDSDLGSLKDAQDPDEDDKDKD